MKSVPKGDWLFHTFIYSELSIIFILTKEIGQRSITTSLPYFFLLTYYIKSFALYFFFNVTSLISTTPPLFWERIAT